MSERLESLLQAQTQEMQRHYSDAQQRAHQAASYVMTVLADEIFIFDLPWSAQHAWLDVLLEHRRFSSRVAGRHFFEMAEQVLQSAQRNALHRDLAACFLLALTLGFQGMHRGPQGHVALQVLRRRLQRFVQGDVPASVPERLFESAYAHCVRSDVEVRVAPVQPWISYARKVLLALLLLSSVLWLWLINPLLRGG